ncbi:MAG: hypothetical protein V1495_03070 [Pseudomonadota bacterium]
MSEETKFRLKIPAMIQPFLKSDAPKDAKLLAAQGRVPMGPAVLVTVLTFFLDDTDTEVREAARATMLEIPDAVLKTTLSEPAHPKTLDFFARERINSEPIVETILLNLNTSDETFLRVADKVPERLTTIILNNQVRLLRLPTIGEAVRRNPNALKSSVDTMISFLRMKGILLEGVSPELTGDEIAAILEQSATFQPIPVAPGETPPPQEFPSELLEDFEEEEEEITEQKKQSLFQALQTMTVGAKIKLALLGNKEARAMLIKDSNKIVATSVIKSPKITDGEVVTIANMRTVYDEIIRIIAITPAWTRHYGVQFALANNPKTPFPIALKYARGLNLNDLDKLAKNKNVSPQLQKVAKELFNQRR